MIHSPRVFRGGADAGIGQALWVIVFVCCSGGSGSAGSPFESNPAFCRWGAGGADGGVRRTVLEHWSALDPTRDASEGNALAGFLHDPLRAAADGADGVRPAVSLVRWPVDRRSDLGSLGVLEKPRSAPRGRCRGEVPQCGSGSAGSEATPVERTLQRRWYSHRGVGLDEELPTHGRGGYR